MSVLITTTRDPRLDQLDAHEGPHGAGVLTPSLQTATLANIPTVPNAPTGGGGGPGHGGPTRPAALGSQDDGMDSRLPFPLRGGAADGIVGHGLQPVEQRGGAAMAGGRHTGSAAREDGPDGPDGPDGSDGTDGPDGSDGADSPSTPPPSDSTTFTDKIGGTLSGPTDSTGSETKSLPPGFFDKEPPAGAQAPSFIDKVVNAVGDFPVGGKISGWDFDQAKPTGGQIWIHGKFDESPDGSTPSGAPTPNRPRPGPPSQNPPSGATPVGSPLPGSTPVEGTPGPSGGGAPGEDDRRRV
jgi:hypothetical protein